MRIHNPRVDIKEKLPLCLNEDNVSYIRKIITDYNILPLKLKNTSANCDWCILKNNKDHFDNVFYDIKLQKLIIIDYGRMSISSMNSLSRPLLGKFNKEIENVMSSLYISPSPFTVPTI